MRTQELDYIPSDRNNLAQMRMADCRHGGFLFWPHDQYIGRSLDLYGEYSEAEIELFAKLLKPGHVVIEVGSNNGCMTVPLAKLVGDAGRVFAFEAQRVVFQQACANVALNGLLNVWLYPVAVGAHHGQIGVPFVNYLQENNFGGIELVAKSPEMIEMVCLDDQPFEPSFIKIDVEGMELDVILGASKKIDKFRPVLYVENDRPGKTAGVIQALIDRKFDMWWHIPPLFRKNNFRGNLDNVFPGIVSSNMLCVPQEYKLNVQGLRKVFGPEDTSGVTLQ